jgi:hypothetical protein
MIRLWWWLVDLVSQGLEPDERDAVRGDLAECGATGGQALSQVLGLVVRRQGALWINWRPWVGLLFLAIPVGIVFCVVSKLLADGSAIYLWVYTNYWSPTILENAAYRHDFLQYVGITLRNYGMLAGAAWISGFALGFVCRRGLPLNAVLFGVLLFFGEILYSPRSPVWMVYTLRDLLGFFWTPGFDRHHHSLYALSVLGRNYFSVNAIVFENPFYRSIFPLLVQTVLVLLPSLWGMRQSLLRLNRSKENHQ